MFKGFILNEFGDKGHTWFLKTMAKRKSLGFESESSRLSKIPVDALEEVRKILELTGFMEEIEK